MSKLERLSIRGIRNFGVDAEEEQSITFSSPLTLILGKNGSGKTTIIECIKFALTADMPPKCQNNADKINFIYNPNVLNISESTAMVKLTLKNVRNEEKTVSREAKVTKKSGKLSFESIGATISDGDTSIGQRIGDAPATEIVCGAMGVSKAIINHVLFCHQEEANWPFGTDKEVQKKFEEIFETDKYNKVLVKIQKIRDRHESVNKDKREILKELEMNKEHADDLAWKISECERELKEMSEEKEAYAVQLKTLDEHLQKSDECRTELLLIATAKIKVETELKSQQENARNLSAKIQNIFVGSDDALENEIESFKVQQMQKHNELEAKKLALQSAEGDFIEISKKVEENDRNYHLLVKDQSREKYLHAEKMDYIQQMCDKLDIKTFNAHASDSIAMIQCALAKVNDEIQKIITTNNRIDAEQGTDIENQRFNEIGINNKIALIDQQLRGLETQLEKNKNELKSVQQNDEKLKKIRIQIAKNKDELEQLTATINTQSVRIEIASHRDEEHKLDEKLNEIDAQITSITAMATRMVEVRANESHLKQRQDEIHNIRQKHRKSFQILFPNENIDNSFKQRIDSLGKELRFQTKLLESETQTICKEIQQKESQLQNKKQQRNNFEEELKHLEEEINRECDQVAFDDVLTSARESFHKCQMEFSALQSSGVFYENYIQKMKDHPSCPLCHKDMNGNEINHLNMELNEKINSLPESIARSECLLKESQIKLEKLLGMQRSVERINTLKSNSIPQIKSEIDQIEVKMLELNNKMIEKKQNISVPKSNLNLIDEIISTGDMRILDDALLDIKQTRKDLEQLQHDLPEANQTKNYDLVSIQNERKEVVRNMKKLKDEISRKEKCINDCEHQRHQLQREGIELQSNEMELQRITQRRNDFVTNIKKISEDIHKFREEKTTNEQSLIPIRDRIRAAEENRRLTRAQNAERLNEETNRRDDLDKSYNSIERVSKELEGLAVLNLTEKIEGSKSLLKKFQMEKPEKKHLIDKIRNEIQTLRDDLAKGDNIKRNLDDNLELKEIQMKIDNKLFDLQKMQTREQEINCYFNQQEMVDLQNKQKKIASCQDNIAGRMSVKQNSYDDLRAEMQQPKYLHANIEYRKANIENIVRAKAIKDLDHYCEAFEKALTKYHSDKISQLNESIRALWRSIYRGNDIDHIEICTEEEEKCRRKYTYRVMASKNDFLMNFRGQCSAGQRVLACLIIRMALAEIFGGHCGVLALDEPTTNLDAWNIESLCEALNRIVEERGAQSNFMLIVITHDEEFLRAMRHASSCYRIYRDTNDAHGKSRIERVETC